MKTVKTMFYTVLIFSILIAVGVGVLMHYDYLPIKEKEIITYTVPVELNTVDIIRYLNPRVDPTIAPLIADAIDNSSSNYKLPKNLVTCMVFRESGFSTLAVSSSNCKGLGQINDKAHADKIKRRNLKPNEIFFIKNNIDLACEILSENLVYTKGDLDGALQMYVGRSHATYVQEVFASLGRVSAEVR